MGKHLSTMYKARSSPQRWKGFGQTLPSSCLSSSDTSGHAPQGQTLVESGPDDRTQVQLWGLCSVLRAWLPVAVTLRSEDQQGSDEARASLWSPSQSSVLHWVFLWFSSVLDARTQSLLIWLLFLRSLLVCIRVELITWLLFYFPSLLGLQLESVTVVLHCKINNIYIHSASIKLGQLIAFKP